MNKAYLLVICLLLAPFTGCIEVTKEESEITTEPVEDEDYTYENEEKTEEIIKKILNDENPQPGSAKKRKGNEPLSGKTTLLGEKNA